MYLIKFDEEGKKISAVPLILADDWGGVEKIEKMKDILKYLMKIGITILVIVAMVIMIQDI